MMSLNVAFNRINCRLTDGRTVKRKCIKKPHEILLKSYCQAKLLFKLFIYDVYLMLKKNLAMF